MRRWPTTRHLPVVAVASAMCLFAASPAIARADRVRVEGELVRYSSQVPTGAKARVQAVYDSAGDSVVTLHVWGLRPNTEYGAHAHVNSCGPNGPDAGGHFQQVPAPAPASVSDPAYANPVNEIWLDFETDESGNAAAQTRQPWQFTPDRRAKSVIIHVEHTHTGQTDSGVAGARLACLSVGF